MGFSMAIDGPAGAGKSTIARITARRLDLIYIDTGAMYRAVAFYFNKNKIDYNNETEINNACKNIDISIEYKDELQQVVLNGENITSHLRDEAVGKMASAVAKLAPVRQKLVELQRKLAGERRIVMDGRDIGTCVLPDADIKIYLTASSQVRAKRRYDELNKKGESCDINVIEQDIISRDEADMNREISPLRQAEDAIYVDTSKMTIDEVVKELMDIYKGLK